MFNPTLIVIEAFIHELRTMYERTYGVLEPGYPGVISFVAQLALENIATSDAARANYPDFFWKTVRPYIGDALRYLRVTQEGQQWIANLYANVFSMEHRGQLIK